MSIRDITVIITSFRSNEKIINCLKSIDRQCQIILVENSNDIEIKEKIEKEFNNVKCILTGENLGYGKANNLGLKRANTKYALILNPDSSLDPTALKSFLKVAEQCPNFSIIAPSQQDQKNNNKIVEARQSNPMQVKNVKGFAMFLNLSKFKDIGYFDENFFIYFEEIDLCKRLTDLNKKIYLAPNIVINHEGAQSHDKSINKEMELSRNWHWMWSTFYYHKKHHNYFYALVITSGKLVRSFLKMIIYTINYDKKKQTKYYARFLGIINSMIGRKSWYRVKSLFK